MTIDTRKCPVCRNPDVRRGVESMWNDGMTQAAIVRVLGDKMTSASITKHLKEHEAGKPSIRQVDIEPELPARERVLALQRLQLNEVERRIELAKETADRLNENLDKLAEMGAEGWSEVPRHDWSEFYDILGKDAQAAFNSIQKTQGLSDKRDKAQGDLKLGLFEAMVGAGLAPKSISGGQSAMPMLQSGDDDDSEGPEVSEVREQESHDARSGGEER